MNQKQFSLVAGLFFLLVAVMHALRLAFGWQAVLAGWTVPTWIGWPALLIAGFLAYQGLKLSRRG
jgi:hypothetical protein